MKKFTFFIACIIIAGPTVGQGFFNIQKSYIQQLDADSYRLRIEVDWEEETLPAPSEPHFSYASPGLPQFQYFELSSPQNTYNFYNNYNDY
ncbi:MAG: hypothetical protein ABIE07_14455 [Candidatus Zixiibacteriota bacterium]